MIELVEAPKKFQYEWLWLTGGIWKLAIHPSADVAKLTSESPFAPLPGRPCSAPASPGFHINNLLTVSDAPNSWCELVEICCFKVPISPLELNAKRLATTHNHLTRSPSHPRKLGDIPAITNEILHQEHHRWHAHHLVTR